MAKLFWYLNNWLSTFRNVVNSAYKSRSIASDGTIGDAYHQQEAGGSEHNPDKDGTVDAWDMDVNLYGSGVDTGTRQELEHIEDLKRVFQKDPGAQLWVHRGQIANRDVSGWLRRPYHGTNGHWHHVHWQSRSTKERDNFAGYTEVIEDAINVPEPNVGGTMGQSGGKGISAAPKWPGGKALSATPKTKYSAVAKAWQRQMKARGWRIDVDGYYGPASAKIARAFQAEKKLSSVDGKLGPETWAAAWLTKVTK